MRIAKEHPCPQCGRAVFRLRNGRCGKCKNPTTEASPKRIFSIKVCPGCGKEAKRLGGVVCGECRKNLLPGQLQAVQEKAPPETPRVRTVAPGLWNRDGRTVEVTECAPDEDGVILVTYHSVGAPLYATQQDFLTKYSQ